MPLIDEACHRPTYMGAQIFRQRVTPERRFTIFMLSPRQWHAGWPRDEQGKMRRRRAAGDGGRAAPLMQRGGIATTPATAAARCRKSAPADAIKQAAAKDFAGHLFSSHHRWRILWATGWRPTPPRRRHRPTSRADASKMQYRCRNGADLVIEDGDFLLHGGNSLTRQLSTAGRRGG